jgi:hypothetical protein
VTSLVVKDLSVNEELEREALSKLTGGSRTGLLRMRRPRSSTKKRASRWKALPAMPRPL